jgi:nucleoside-triphosphatase THEP1
MKAMSNANNVLDQIIAQKIGNLELTNTKLQITIEALKQEIVKRDAIIASLKATTEAPELPMGDDIKRAAASEIDNVNGKAH